MSAYKISFKNYGVSFSFAIGLPQSEVFPMDDMLPEHEWRQANCGDVGFDKPDSWMGDNVGLRLRRTFFLRWRRIWWLGGGTRMPLVGWIMESVSAKSCKSVGLLILRRLGGGADGGADPNWSSFWWWELISPLMFSVEFDPGNGRIWFCFSELTPRQRGRRYRLINRNIWRSLTGQGRTSLERGRLVELLICDDIVGNVPEGLLHAARFGGFGGTSILSKALLLEPFKCPCVKSRSLLFSTKLLT